MLTAFLGIRSRNESEEGLSKSAETWGQTRDHTAGDASHPTLLGSSGRVQNRWTSGNAVPEKTGNPPVHRGGLWERGLKEMKAELVGGPGELEGPVETAPEPSLSCRVATEENLRLALQLNSSVTMNLLSLSLSSLLAGGDSQGT